MKGSEIEGVAKVSDSDEAVVGRDLGLGLGTSRWSFPIKDNPAVPF